MNDFSKRIMAAIAAGSALASGCTTRSIDDANDSGAEAGSTTEPDDDTSSGESEADATTQVTSSASTSGSGDGDDGVTSDGIKFDLGGNDDGSMTGDVEPPLPPAECLDPPNEGFGCEIELAPNTVLVYRCMDAPAEDCASLEPWDVVQDARDCSPTCDGGFLEVACGPDPGVQDACCHWLVWTEELLCPGRPFVVDDVARLPATSLRSDWSAELDPELSALDPRLRARLAAGWLEHARYEHASVASFARFVLQLLAVGAPASLVELAQMALREELEHARCFYALASAYRGSPLGPDRLPIEDSLQATDLTSVTLATVREGCIAETVSALHIAVAAERARDPAVAAALGKIAREELSHAELAWTFVAWAMQQGDHSLRHEVADLFREAGRYVPAGPDLDQDAELSTHGLLSRAERTELAGRALDTLVAPAMAALFEPHTTFAPSLQGSKASSMVSQVPS